jgi:guanylate kinase
MIITLTGASGSGKTTIAKTILSLIPNAKLLTSYTTRRLRTSDLPNEYAYLDSDVFHRMKNRGDFLWTAEITDVRHGTTKRSVDYALEDQTTIWIMILVPDVLLQLRAFAEGYGKFDEITSFFILVPNEETLRSRMAARGDNPESAEARLDACREYERDARTSRFKFFWIDNSGELNAAVDEIVDRLGQ